MEKQRKIIIEIQFNTLKYSDKRLTEEWIRDRVNIFRTYTLKSFIAQTNQNFEAYLMYDKLSAEAMQKVLSEGEPMPPNVFFKESREGKSCIENSCSGYEKLYLVRLDSDNLYTNDYIQLLHDYIPKPETEVIVCQNGYIYEESTDKLGKYWQPSPPFYTLIYNPLEYIRGFRYTFPGGHKYVTQHLQYELVEGRHYLVTIHGSNVSNASFMMRRIPLLVGEERQEVLQKLGLL